jgi:FkbM family methyltransferase
MSGWRGRVARAAIERLNGAGYTFTKYPQPGSFHALVAGTTTARNVDLCIDVGAHQGEFGSWLRRELGFQGDIVSFEPAPDAYAVLRSRAASDPKWTTYELAVSDRDDRVILNVADEESQYSSLHSFRAGAVGDTGLAAQHVRQLEVKAVTLDSFDPVAERVAAATTTLLKSDTQGNDRRVFEGARGLLPSIDLVVSEVNVKPLYVEAWLIEEAIRFFRDAGFLPMAFRSAGRSSRDRTVLDMDGFFARPVDGC